MMHQVKGQVSVIHTVKTMMHQVKGQVCYTHSKDDDVAGERSSLLYTQ